jgi:hypothetical protein
LEGLQSVEAIKIKLKRDTKPATKRAQKLAWQRREKLIEKVREEVFVDFCQCGQCADGDYSNLCISHTDLAGTLNTFKIPTSRGKVGTWQATSIKRLFQDYIGRSNGD